MNKSRLGIGMFTYQQYQIRYAAFFFSLAQLSIMKFGKVNTSSVSQVHRVRSDPKGTGFHFESRNSGGNEVRWILGFKGRSYRVQEQPLIDEVFERWGGHVMR